MIRKQFFYTLIIIIIYGCKANKSFISEEKGYLNNSVNTDDYEESNYIKNLLKNKDVDSLLSTTTNFYDIKILSKPSKRFFNLNEQKKFSLNIANYGSKELYLPEYFKRNNLNNSEIFVKLYKKKKEEYLPYVQKKMTTVTHIHGNIDKGRAILETKRGKCIYYDSISIDLFQKIVDEGVYKAEIYIDLSNFGYFKILKTDIFFEVNSKY